MITKSINRIHKIHTHSPLSNPYVKLISLCCESCESCEKFHWKSRGNNQASTKVWGGILNTPPEFYCTWSNFPKLIAPFSVRACLIK